MASSGKYRLLSKFVPGDGLFVPSQSPAVSGIQYYPGGIYGNPLTSESDLYGMSAPHYPSGHMGNYYSPGSHQAIMPASAGSLPSDQRSAPLIENFTETPIDFEGPEPTEKVERIPEKRKEMGVYVGAALLFVLAGGYYFTYRSLETKMGPQDWKIYLGVGVALTGVAIVGHQILKED